MCSRRWSEESPVVLSCQGLVKRYAIRKFRVIKTGEATVVNNVSFEVHKGEVVGLLGPNGAGKTTSFRITCGLIGTDAGKVILDGKDITSWPMYRRAKDGGMVYLPQDPSVFRDLSAEKNLYLAMEMIGIPRSEQKKRCEDLLERFDLKGIRNRRVGAGGSGGISGGERRRLEIARALLSKPRILLLDEPFAAVDPNTVTEIQHVIRELAEDGIAILITDHQVPATTEIADYCYVIEHGKVLIQGTPIEVLGSPEAQKCYFGENAQQQLENLLKKLPRGGSGNRRGGGANHIAGHIAGHMAGHTVDRLSRETDSPVSRAPRGYVVEDADEEVRSFRVSNRGGDEEEVISPRDRTADKMNRGQSIYRRRS